MCRQRFILFFVFIILAGCTAPSELQADINKEMINSEAEKEELISIDTGIDAVVPDEAGAEEKSDSETKAVNDAQQFIQIIKEQDEVRLLQFLDTADLDLEGAKKIIEGFNNNFDLNTISIQLYYDGNRMSIEDGQYEFILLDKNTKENNEENPLVIRYEKDGRIMFHNPYIRYFPYAENMLLRYLELIKQERVSELASFLNSDDLEVPDWVADKTIKHYQEFSKSMNLSLRYIHHFIFVIEDGKGTEHEIEVIYGDGLMSIKDDFIPSF